MEGRGWGLGGRRAWEGGSCCLNHRLLAGMRWSQCPSPLAPGVSCAPLPSSLVSTSLIVGLRLAVCWGTQSSLKRISVTIWKVVLLLKFRSNSVSISFLLSRWVLTGPFCLEFTLVGQLWEVSLHSFFDNCPFLFLKKCALFLKFILIRS